MKGNNQELQILLVEDNPADAEMTMDALRASGLINTVEWVKVVVLTSSQEESDIVRAYDLGANGYLVKPVGSEEFLKSVGDLGLYWMLLNRLPGETS
jgi:CheY-like chemotaxis protein